ncbi:hypothetical protein LXA43DRAFT_305936 [Ganoderma leucocontextum]|nr:hypothetical protein LXA43DRAFT_305936 [Ganoderma leucocontextum]
MAPSASRLLDIPEDVRIRILLALDTISLLRCKRLCRDIRDLLNNAIEVEYKLALARAGRVELGQSRLCIADCLRALRTLCTTVFPLNALPFILLPDEVIPHWPGVTDGFIPYLANYRLDLVLWRPPLPLCDPPTGQRKSVPAVMSHISESRNVPKAVMGTLTVDIAQDLLVFSRPARPEISPPECFVYSISEGRPHSAAGPDPFRIAFDPVCTEGGFNTIEDLQIFGDVVAWSITDDQKSAVHVWNWKTSVLIWHQQSRSRGSCCVVISPSLVVLVTAQAVSVYEFDSSAERRPPPASLATALCVLELPRLKTSRFAPYVRAYMQFPPSAPAQPGDQTLAFGLDPARTVLTVTLLQSIDVEGGVVSERYAIFVPLSTLSARITATPALAGGHTGTGSANQRRRTVRWAEWGPGGTRVVRFAYISHISVMGSRCAFMLNEDHSGALHVVLFDVRRGVGDETTGQRLEDLHDELFDAAEVLQDTLAFAEEIRTTFPVEVVRKTCQGLSGYLVQDGVAISHQAWGMQGALGEQWYDPRGWL